MVRMVSAVSLCVAAVFPLSTFYNRRSWSLRTTAPNLLLWTDPCSSRSSEHTAEESSNRRERRLALLSAVCLPSSSASLGPTTHPSHATPPQPGITFIARPPDPALVAPTHLSHVLRYACVSSRWKITFSCESSLSHGNRHS